jgi:hypothetical protein
VVLKYRVEGDEKDSTVRLYERERVERLEQADPEVIYRLSSTRARREQLEQQRRQEEERARREEEERRELEKRLARQKVVRIDERLK